MTTALCDLHLTLPLSNPVVIFSLVLFIILFAPLLFNRIRVPHIIGLILAGMIVGPYGFNLLLRDSSIVLFGTVGLLYIMFTAGLEIDLDEFRKNKFKSLVFGWYTFLLPMTLGALSVHYLLGFDWPASLLMASMFASHTLLAYPIASKYGVARIRSVTLTIGGTIITDILALLVLAGITGLVNGTVGTEFWLLLALRSLILGLILFFLFPLVARWFFKRSADPVSQYIFVLAMVFLGAFLAEAAGLEPIIGAFLAGLTLNRFIPHQSALMNRIEFVGNAFFIPFFLISVGMLIDFRVLFKGLGALKVAAVMTAVGIGSKFLAAWLTQASFRLSRLERNMIFGLSTARVGATLAIVLVGYNLIVGETPAGEPIRLLDEDVLNGTIIMILVTCTISSFQVERASRRIALANEHQQAGGDEPGRILVSLAYPETVTDLVDFGLMLQNGDQTIPVFALNIVADDPEAVKTEAMAKKIMDQAVKHAAASDQVIQPIFRHDISISNGIIYTLREWNITDAVIGLHHQANASNFLGPVAERILKNTSETVFIHRSLQPFNTFRRIMVIVPPKAELEPGFSHWVHKLRTIARKASLKLRFFAAGDTISELKDALGAQQDDPAFSFQVFDRWEDFLILAKEVGRNDLLAIVASRRGHVSYQAQQEKLPHYLTQYFSTTSFLMIYPRQMERGVRMNDIQFVDGRLAEGITEQVRSAAKAASMWQRIFRRRKNES